MIDSEDHRRRRCRRLGHEVDFGYCRRQEGNRVCPLILDCWWETFDVGAFLRERLEPASWGALQHRARPDKLANILELIEAAKKRRETSSDA